MLLRLLPNLNSEIPCVRARESIAEAEMNIDRSIDRLGSDRAESMPHYSSPDIIVRPPSPLAPEWPAGRTVGREAASCLIFLGGKFQLGSSARLIMQWQAEKRRRGVMSAC